MAHSLLYKRAQSLLPGCVLGSIGMACEASQHTALVLEHLILGLVTRSCSCQGCVSDRESSGHRSIAQIKFVSQSCLVTLRVREDRGSMRIGRANKSCSALYESYERRASSCKRTFRRGRRIVGSIEPVLSQLSERRDDLTAQRYSNCCLGEKQST